MAKTPPPQPPPPDPDYSGIVNVLDRGVLPNVSTDQSALIQAVFDECFGTASAPHGNETWRNRTPYFPAGVYRAQNLTITRALGGHVYGADMTGTRIEAAVEHQPVFRTNGASHMIFEKMHLRAFGETPVFDLNADGVNGNTSLQSNAFYKMLSEGGRIGYQVGAGGFMGSEMSWRDCKFQGHARAAMLTCNYNALQQTIDGGNVQACGVGFEVGLGSINSITGVGFQQSAECDIRTSGAANNTMEIAGCRSESPNFLHNNAGHAIDVIAVHHTGVGPGDFIKSSGGMVSVRAFVSLQGRLKPEAYTTLVVDNGWIKREDWIDASGLGIWPTYTGLVDIRSVYHGEAGQTLREMWTPVQTPEGIRIERRRQVYEVLGFA